MITQNIISSFATVGVGQWLWGHHLIWITFMSEGLCVFLTIDPAGKPGSHTTAESRPMIRSCSWTTLGLRLRSPACSMWSVGSLVLRSKWSTFPKQRRNCITIKQSPKQLSGNRRPGNRDSSGRAYRRWLGEKKVRIYFYRVHPHAQKSPTICAAFYWCTACTALASFPLKKQIIKYCQIQLTYM